MVAGPDNHEPLPLFFLGMVILSPGAITALRAVDQDPLEILHDHQYGVWGSGSDHVAQEKFTAVQLGLRIFSSHVLADGQKVWLITEGTRASTLVVLPSEF
jgi:hypothetical protein